VTSDRREYRRGVEDLGPPIAYLALEPGVPVYERNGERVGVVEHVMADDAADIFDGVIVHTLPLVGRRMFADVDQIAELRERGVLLSTDRDALHEPRERPADNHPGSLDRAEGLLEARLRRAWDWLGGRR
jgi:hypothetical protein